MDQWLIIHLHEKVWVANLAEETDVDSLVDAARVLAGFPSTDDWWQDPTDMSVILTMGEPHPTLMARATVLTVEQLRGASPADVAEDRRQRAEAARGARVAAARAALAQLDPAERDEALRPQIRGT